VNNNTEDSVYKPGCCILNLDDGKDCNENNIVYQGNILLQNDRSTQRAFNNKIVLKQELFI